MAVAFQQFQRGGAEEQLPAQAAGGGPAACSVAGAGCTAWGL